MPRTSMKTRKLASHRQAWSNTDLKTLRQLAKRATPARLTAMRLGRTASAVQQKASSLGISFRSTSRATMH